MDEQPNREQNRIDTEIKQLELEEKRVRLQVTRQEVAAFHEKESEKARITKIRVEAVQREREEAERRHRACKHKTGGKGKPGFLHGDGAKGYCVGQTVLPTGELYMTCSRCQKEWHHPSWIMKIEVVNTGKTTMTRTRYERMEADYNEALNWDHPYTEMMEASQFKIPLLERIDVTKIPFAKEEATVGA